jgi:hypothetical protein
MITLPTFTIYSPPSFNQPKPSHHPPVNYGSTNTHKPNPPPMNTPPRNYPNSLKNGKYADINPPSVKKLDDEKADTIPTIPF